MLRVTVFFTPMSRYCPKLHVIMYMERPVNHYSLIMSPVHRPTLETRDISTLASLLYFNRNLIPIGSLTNRNDFFK